uniref:Uncharacterized protein n=1 Tax=Candidatus Kentrum sp. FW TaxID=2126338 RepID=A0A450SEP6_9GAMM|nr:MAG: hypothetical protein BECKFW1821B_GA0114236_100831 [Candidatus Kentron sp. FW]
MSTRYFRDTAFRKEFPVLVSEPPTHGRRIIARKRKIKEDVLFILERILRYIASQSGRQVVNPGHIWIRIISGFPWSVIIPIQMAKYDVEWP